MNAASKVKTASKFDLRDPKVRYELLRIQEFQGLQKAYIMDHLIRKASLIRVGETIGDCKLLEILAKEEALRLKPNDGPEFVLRRPKLIIP